METETRVVQALEALATSNERLAVANEQLIRLATDERDAGMAVLGPPFCPHCGTLNPRISDQRTGDGEMADFVLVATCDNCKQQFFAVPQGWLAFTDSELAKRQVAEAKP